LPPSHQAVHAALELPVHAQHVGAHSVGWLHASPAAFFPDHGVPVHVAPLLDVAIIE
jgi:hypothetical protein